MKLLVLFTLSLLHTAPSELKELRNWFPQLQIKKEAVFSIKTIVATNPPSLINKAYEAAAQMASAQYQINPFSKINSFNDGKKQLEVCLQKEPQNIELRFIRFVIQHKVPSILGYSQELQNDRVFLINNAKFLRIKDPDLYARVFSFLLVQANLSSDEKIKLQE